MNAFFYFLAFEFIFVTIPETSGGPVDYLGVSVILLPVVLSNTGLVRRQFNVTRNWVVNANLAAICLGIISAFIQGYYVVNSDLGYWEIIEKMN